MKPKLSLLSILGNSQKLDGGALFGNAAKELWKQWVNVDSKNRIPLQCRSLLFQKKDTCVLFETGVGSFFPPKLRNRFGVDDTQHQLLKGLATAGYEEQEVTHVVLSHLHFDHAGGLLHPYEAGKPLQLLFPNAHILVSSSAFHRASNPHPRDRASFISGLPELLQKSGRLEIIHDGDTDHSLAEFVTFQFFEGHTPGMMLSSICVDPATAVRPRRLLFGGDLIPGKSWVHLPITMGYDRFPELVYDEKKRALEEVSEEAGNTDLFFFHDPTHAVGRIRQDEKGRMTVERSWQTAESWDKDTRV